jgi:micrococcal nuclease
MTPDMLMLSLSLVCAAVDGDTLRCAPTPLFPKGERIRLLGIDAPEMRGHCRKGRRCAPGDPHASAASLASALRNGAATIERIGSDRYGRTLAMVRVGGQDLSCWQLSRGKAIYRPDWDNGRRVASRCPDAARR